MLEEKAQTCLDLFERIKEDEDFLLEELRLYILEEIITAMESKNINRAELARRLNTSRAYVTKLFNTSVNLTLRSIIKITQAIGVKISVHCHEAATQAVWFDIYKYSKVEKFDESFALTGYERTKYIRPEGVENEHSTIGA